MVVPALRVVTSHSVHDYENSPWCGAFENVITASSHAQPRRASPLPSDSDFAADQQAKTKAILFTKSAKKSLTLALGLRLRCRPAGQDEGDLVHEVSQIVHHIQQSLVHRSEQVAVVISERIDRPSCCHDDSHVVEGVLHCCRAISGHSPGLALEDLEEDVAPAAHAEEEANPSLEHTSFSCISECKHHDSAQEQPPEALGGDGLLCCLEDQVELNHLQWNGDAPIHIAVHDWGLVHLHPVLTHVHVMHSCHQSHQGAHVKRSLPVVGDCLFFQRRLVRNDILTRPVDV